MRRSIQLGFPAKNQLSVKRNTEFKLSEFSTTRFDHSKEGSLCERRLRSESFAWIWIGVLTIVVFCFSSSIVVAQNESVEQPAANEIDGSPVDKGTASEAVDESDGSNESEVEDHRRADIPFWAERKSFTEGGVEFVVVTTDDGSHWAKHYWADEALDPAIEAAVSSKCDHWFGVGAGKIAKIDDRKLLSSLIHLDRRVVRKYHIDFDSKDIARFDTESEEFYRGFAQLRFDSEFRRVAEKMWKRNLTRNRLIYAGFIGLAVLGVLGVAYGFLHFNHLTRGFYVGRLQTFAVGAIIALIAISYYLTILWVPS